MSDATADVLVVFGITGDLAKVMTFRSLYRLEKRGLLDCPIIGVAVDDWTVDQLVQRARDSIVGTGEQLDEDVFKRLAARFSYVSGDFGDDATYARVAAAIKGKSSPVFYLEIPPFLFGRVVKGLHDAGLTADARVVVEKPFGHDKASAHRPRGGAASVHRRVAALPDRPLPREDGARRDPPSPVRERDARAGLEPQLRLQRGDHDGGGLRSRGPRTLLRSRRRVARRRRQPPDAGGRSRGDGAAVARRPADAQGLAGRAVPRGQGGRSRRLRARPVRRLPLDRRRRRRLDDGDVRGAPARDRELALGRRAVLHPHRQAAAGDADGAPARVPPPAEARLRRVRLARAEPARRQARPVDGNPGCSSRRKRADQKQSGHDRARRGVRGRGRRGPDAVRGAAARGARSGTRRGSRGRTASRRRGGSCSRCSTRRRPCTRTRRARGGRRKRTTSSPGTASGTDPGS